MKTTDNPIVDMLTLRRDLYFVMSLLLADKETAKIPNVTTWTKVFHEGEVRRLMLWTAAAIRGLLDLLNQKEDGFSKKYCGEYWADYDGGEKTALTFRQACNSAIHAKEILPYKVSQKESKRRGKRVYTNRITVRGTHRGKKSRAQLDIIRFVKIADTLINTFEENDHANR